MKAAAETMILPNVFSGAAFCAAVLGAGGAAASGAESTSSPSTQDAADHSVPFITHAAEAHDRGRHAHALATPCSHHNDTLRSRSHIMARKEGRKMLPTD